MGKNKKFKVMFVYPNLMLQTTFPTGIALLSAKIQENGYKSCLFDTTFYQTEKVSSDEYRMEHLQIAKFNMGDKFKMLPSKSKMLEDLQEMIVHEKPDLITYSFVEDVFPLTLDDSWLPPHGRADELDSTSISRNTNCKQRLF